MFVKATGVRMLIAATMVGSNPVGMALAFPLSHHSSRLPTAATSTEIAKASSYYHRVYSHSDVNNDIDDEKENWMKCAGVVGPSRHHHRRTFLSSSGTTAVAAAAVVVAGWRWNSELALADEESSILPVVADVDIYPAVSRDIAALIQKNPDWGPTLVRLAWHSSGTYDQTSQTGGSGGGTIRFPKELAHGGNAGLASTAVEWLEPIHEKYRAQGLSYADLYTLAGVTAIHEMGGPIIGWSAGRVDQDESKVTPDGRLPNADSGPPLADPMDSKHLRSIFYRMGFNDQEIVALSGAHALGRCHETASGYSGPWSPTPTLFNNAYFVLLKGLTWIPKPDWTGPPQYVNSGSGKLMMLPTDVVLLQDPQFKKWVDVYAKDASRFNKDFARVFQTLEELGTSGLTPVKWV